MSPVSDGGMGLSRLQVGSIMSGFTMAYGPAKFVAGILSDLVSPRGKPAHTSMNRSIIIITTVTLT